MHLFHIFPPEIQLKIWRSTFPPRVVSLRFDAEAKAYTSNATPPVALSVCKQSRDETKRFYQLTFGNEIDQGRVWIHFDIDTVLFMNSVDPAYQSELPDLAKFLSKTKGVQKIKILAMEVSLAEVVRVTRVAKSNKPWIQEILFPAMRNLEKVFEVWHLCNSDFLADGASGYVLSRRKQYEISSDDLSLVPDMRPGRPDLRYSVEDLTAEQEQDSTAQNVRGRKDMERVVVWSNMVFNYRNLPIILVLEDFESIMPIVQIDKLEGLQDPNILKVVDAKFVRRPEL
jgi:hypothetical protein